MKTDAPEKIYLIRNFPRTTSLNTTNDYHGKYLQEWYESREKEADIEYTRTDAFIEKACEWLSNHVNDYIINDKYILPNGKISRDWLKVKFEMFEDFKKYMKGE